MTEFENENNERMQDIVCEIAINNRECMINCIKRTAGEEYENLQSLWDLSKKTKKQLRQVLKGIYDYYLNEFKEI
jgi:hypothetical protein